MTAGPDLLALLARLYLAYPEKVHDPATVALYLEGLADIPAWLLEKTVQQCIETSAWFPKISELRQLAARLANTRDFAALDPFPVDHLAAEALALEDAFYHTGRLDPDKWERLAWKFNQVDRSYRAEYTLEKLRRLQLIQF